MFRDTKSPKNIQEKSRRILATNLIRFRKTEDLSREELAFRCEISTRQIENIELGKCAISIDTLDKISAGTGLSVTFLLQENSK